MTVRAVFVSILMVLTALAAARLAPAYDVQSVSAPDLEAVLPGDFANWRRLDIAAAVLPPEADLGPGEAVSYAAWADRAGRVVTLVVAYGPPLGDSVRLHRPEVCYRAQGFDVVSRREDVFAAGALSAPVIRLDTEHPLRSEAVTYWLRDGDAYLLRPGAAQWNFFRRGGTAADGALVRVSSRGTGPAEWRLHDRFLTDFVSALSPDARALLTADPA